MGGETAPSPAGSPTETPRGGRSAHHGTQLVTPHHTVFSREAT